MKKKGVSGRSMYKGLELREHGMPETTFNSAKLKWTVGVGWECKVNAGEEGRGRGVDSKTRSCYLSVPMHQASGTSSSTT